MRGLLRHWTKSSIIPSSCEEEVIVQGDEGPVCGVAQVVDCHVWFARTKLAGGFEQVRFTPSDILAIFGLLGVFTPYDILAMFGPLPLHWPSIMPRTMASSKNNRNKYWKKEENKKQKKRWTNNTVRVSQKHGLWPFRVQGFQVLGFRF